MKQGITRATLGRSAIIFPCIYYSYRATLGKKMSIIYVIKKKKKTVRPFMKNIIIDNY